MKFAATIQIFYNFKIQKRIVSAKTVCGNMVGLLSVKAYNKLKSSLQISSLDKRFRLYLEQGLFVENDAVIV